MGQNQDEPLNKKLKLEDIEVNRRNRMKEFRMGELFCGPGGIALGAKKAYSQDGLFKIKSIWANDIDSDTCQTYIANICDGDSTSVYCSDVRDLDFDCLEPIDAFAFGFPCNSYSQVGEHQGLNNSQFGSLYIYGVDILKKFQPDWFIAENVSGLKSSSNGKDFQIILQDFEKAGYVLTSHMYKFEDYGVPQARHRIIIVGIRKDLANQGIIFHVPSPAPYAHLDISSRTALKNIPSEAPNQEKRKLNNRVRERLSYIQPGQNVWQADLPEELKINTKTKISQIYRKLDPNKPAYTVTASGGGGTYMYHWSEEQRELTNRERARLQTFPDDYEFIGKYSSVRRQIGMAVPPEGAKIIFEAILNTFAHIEYESIEASLK